MNLRQHCLSHTAPIPSRSAQVTTVSEDWEARKSKRPQLVRNFCRSCGADVCHDSLDDDGKLSGRVRSDSRCTTAELLHVAGLR